MASSIDRIVDNPSSTAVCTLFEGDYHLGLAAFVNSLVHAGYAGTVWAGYRGDLPPWIDQLKRQQNPDGYLVTDQVRIIFLPIQTSLHFANYKAQFMIDLLGSYACGCKYLWYFDPDIFLRCSWSHFEKWQCYGIALCEEIVNYQLAETSPLRLQWVEAGGKMGLGKPRLLNRYFNSGLVGASPAHEELLQLWKKIIEYAGTLGYDLAALQPGSREMPFYGIDQDALNMAAMYTELPLTTMGPEAMGFVPSGFTMYHAVGEKPWRGSLLLRALGGVPPSDATKFFFTQVLSPIRPYSPISLGVKRFTCWIAALIGRFYRRQ